MKDRVERVGRPDQSTVLTAVSMGKLRVESSCTSRNVNESSICDKLLADKDAILLFLIRSRLPVILLMPSNAMSSTLLVATAMLPEKVWQVVRAAASAELDTVTVPLHAAEEESVVRSWASASWKHTSCCADHGQGRSDVSKSHCDGFEV